MTIEELLITIFSAAPHLLVKLIAVVLLLLHLCFSFVVVRQTKSMIGVVEAKISPTIYAISIIHLLSSSFVLIWAIIFL